MRRLIVIEGIDGAGKKTQSELLRDCFISRGVRVRELDFPVYDSESSLFVRMYLSGKLGGSPDDTNAYAASMLFAADRYISYRRDWKADADDENTVIIANRYTTSNAIHQLSKLPREAWDDFLAWLFDFEFSKLSLPSPDDVIYLSVSAEISMESVLSRSEQTGQKRDIHELDADYMRRSCEAGLYAAKSLGWKIIECGRGGKLRGRDEIFKDILAALGI